MKIQKRRLTSLLASAQRDVPGQRQRLQNASIDRWDEIEPITKSEMMSSPISYLDHGQMADLGISGEELEEVLKRPDHLRQGWYQDRVLVTKTSGTTGEAGLIFNTQKSWQNQQAYLIGRIGKDALPLFDFIAHRPYRIAFIVLQNPLIVTNQIAESGSRTGGFLADIRTIRVDNNRNHLIDELNDFAPHLIMTYPNILELLAQAKMEGQILYDPKVLVSGSDYLADDQFQLISQAFDRSKMSNLYATSECQPIASTCREGNLHISSDCCMVESVDENNRKVPKGEFGHHILLTGLLNTFQPFIRYRIDDQVMLSDRVCPCGSPQPVMQIRGRSYPDIMVARADGSLAKINSREVRQLLILHPGIKRFEVKCYQEKWTITLFIDSLDREGVDAFASKFKAEIVDSLHGLLDNYDLHGVLELELHFERFDHLATKHLKRKMFTLVEQP